MPIKAVCPRCERKHLLDDKFDGKKIRCKGCDKSFLVGEAADEEEEKPKKDKKKKKKKPQGSPVILIALIGGGVLLLLSCVGGGVGIYFATRLPSTPPVVANDKKPPTDPTKDMSLFEGNKPAEPSKVGAILDEAVASVGRVVNAIAGIGNDAAVAGAVTAIRAETDKINQLTNRLTVAGAPTQADLRRMRNFQRESEPHEKRLTAEVQRLNSNKVLTPASANDLRTAAMAYVSATKSFDGVLGGMVR